MDTHPGIFGGEDRLATINVILRIGGLDSPVFYTR
jgi:hypothetical protein